MAGSAASQLRPQGPWGDRSLRAPRTHLESRRPHEPVQAVVVGGDEAGPPPRVAGLALELVVLPHGARRAGVGAGRALKDDLHTLPGDAEGGRVRAPPTTAAEPQRPAALEQTGRLPWGEGVPLYPASQWAAYLPKAPYVLTILRGLKETFMTCWGLSRLSTTGTLSQATRTPSARWTARRAMQPGEGRW